MMSKDRIEFTMYAPDSACKGTVEAAVRAFGITENQARQLVKTSGIVRCRPSQFGRFIVLRAERVDNNQIKLLNAKIIPGEVDLDFLDVSKNPHDRG